MNTQLSSKLTALAVALMMNAAMMAGVAYLFTAQVDHPTASLVARLIAFKALI
jgi:hypothetical protein